MSAILAMLEVAWPVLAAIGAAIWALVFGIRQGERNAKAREDARRVEQGQAREEARRKTKDMTDEEAVDLLTGRRKP